MKIAAIIFSMLVLALTSIPCCAVDACGDEIGQEERHSEQEESCNNCSPFINCGSCHHFVCIQELPEQQNFSEAIFSEENNNLQLFAQQEFVVKIWEPPRLG